MNYNRNEVVQKGEITRETQEILDRPFLDLPIEDLVNMSNQYIEKATEVLRRGK